MSTVFDSGFSFVAIGFVTIFNNPGYNAFDNRATIPTVLFSIICAILYIKKKITIYVGNWLRVWEINTVDEAGNGD